MGVTGSSVGLSLLELSFELLDLALELLHLGIEFGIHSLDLSTYLVRLLRNLLRNEALDILDLGVNAFDLLFKLLEFLLVLFQLRLGILVFLSFLLKPVELLKLLFDVNVSSVFNSLDFVFNFSDLLFVLLDLIIQCLYLLLNLLLIGHGVAHRCAGWAKIIFVCYFDCNQILDTI